jgi:hypothetical protein
LKVYKFQVLTTQELTPTVSILGDSQKIIKRSDKFVLNSISFVENCTDKIYSKLIYKWSVINTIHGETLKSISSSSQNPSSLIFKRT